MVYIPVALGNYLISVRTDVADRTLHHEISEKRMEVNVGPGLYCDLSNEVLNVIVHIVCAVNWQGFLVKQIMSIKKFKQKNWIVCQWIYRGNKVHFMGNIDGPRRLCALNVIKCVFHFGDLSKQVESSESLTGWCLHRCTWIKRLRCNKNCTLYDIACHVGVHNPNQITVYLLQKECHHELLVCEILVYRVLNNIWNYLRYEIGQVNAVRIGNGLC